MPEVENVVLSLKPNIIGKKIIKVELNYSNGLSQQAIKKIFHKQDFKIISERLTNSIFSDIKRRGKHIIGVISNENYKEELYIHVHLGMAGALLYGKFEHEIIPKFRNHIHVKMTLDNGDIIVFSDIRRHGGFSVYKSDEFKILPSIKNLGPEPFWEDTMTVILDTLRNKKWNNPSSKAKDPLKFSIKSALMDQGVMAGTGNIYACEALREAGINPKELVKDLSDDEIVRIFSKSRDLMAFSIEVGGTTFRDYVNGESKEGNFQNYLKVYGKKNCEVCGTTVISEEIAGRTTHWCPKCQPMKIK